MNAARRRLRVLVSGRVQGVGFRYATAREARRLGLAGWVRNTGDQRVEILVEGPGEQVEALCRWCRRGPPSARVSDVACGDDRGEETLHEFAICRGEHLAGGGGAARRPRGVGDGDT